MAVPAQPAVTSARRLARLPRWAWGVVLAIALLILWFGIIGSIQATIAPDPALRPTAQQLPAGGSAAVAFAARLVDVEVNERSFTPNDPVFFPTGLARRAPAYQRQVIVTTAGFVDALATAPATPGPDAAALGEAARLLAVPPEQWWIAAAWPPFRPSAERAYRGAIEAMLSYNQARADASPNALGPPGASGRLDPVARSALATLAGAVEAQAIASDQQLRGTGETSVGVELAATRGTAHAAAMLMRGLRDDNASAIRLSGNAARWGQALDALDAAAAVDPLVAREGDLLRAGYQLLLAGSAIRKLLE